MFLNPGDIENVAKFNIGQKLERRRRSVQLVVVSGEDDHLKLPPLTRRRSSAVPCPFGTFASSPFLPQIVPKSATACCATCSIVPPPLSSAGLRLFRRRSAFSCTFPLLPQLSLSAAKNNCANDAAEEGTTKHKGHDGSLSVGSVTSASSDPREHFLHQSLIIQSDILQPKEPTDQQNDGHCLRAFVRAQEKLAEHRAHLEHKLDVVSCNRMAVEMIDELLENLHQKMRSTEIDGEKEKEEEEPRSELTLAEVQRDFFPYIYAKAEQLFVNHRMANPLLTNGTAKLTTNEWP